MTSPHDRPRCGRYATGKATRYHIAGSRRSETRLLARLHSTKLRKRQGVLCPRRRRAAKTLGSFLESTEFPVDPGSTWSRTTDVVILLTGNRVISRQPLARRTGKERAAACSAFSRTIPAGEATPTLEGDRSKPTESVDRAAPTSASRSIRRQATTFAARLPCSSVTRDGEELGEPSRRPWATGTLLRGSTSAVLSVAGCSQRSPDSWPRRSRACRPSTSAWPSRCVQRDRSSWRKKPGSLDLRNRRARRRRPRRPQVRQYGLPRATARGLRRDHDALRGARRSTTCT